MGKIRSGKIIKKKINLAGNDDIKDLNKMFSQLTGSSNAECGVLIPKINSLYRNIIEYNKLYNLFLSFKPFTEQFTEYPFWFDDITLFLKELIESTSVDLTKKYDASYDHAYYHMDNQKLNAFYKTLKDNNAIKQIVITSSNLSVYKKNISELDNLDDAFIKREPGITLQPMAFTSLDLKVMWSSDSMNDKAKKFMLSIIRHTYLIGINVYDTLTSPDIDIKKFSKLLIGSIAEMKKQIPRCDKAFNLIEKSVTLLETNFKSYFRGSVEAGNPSIIIESFIVDIASTQKAGPGITAEFNRIIMFLKEKTSQNTDPKVKELFRMLNNNFSAMDKELGVTPTDSSDNKSSEKEAKVEDTNKETKLEKNYTNEETEIKKKDHGLSEPENIDAQIEVLENNIRRVSFNI